MTPRELYDNLVESHPPSLRIEDFKPTPSMRAHWVTEGVSEEEMVRLLESFSPTDFGGREVPILVEI